MRIERRGLLVGCGCAAAGLVLALQRAGRGLAAPSPDLAALRDLVRRGIDRDVTSGAVTAVFDIDADAADEVLLPVTKDAALPDRYAPGDLATAATARIPSNGGQFVRSVIVDDTRALVAAAADEGLRLYIGSGYRSQAYQVAVFAAQTARWGDEDVANRYSARPGHSQHQLGTTIDFTTDFGPSAPAAPPTGCGRTRTSSASCCRIPRGDGRRAT